MKKDYCSKPFKIAVAMGDSVTAGGTATQPELCWVALLTKLLNEAQLEPIKMMNCGLSDDLLSKRSPAYAQSEKYSALERYTKDVIDKSPNLILLAYGLNDARAGTSIEEFIKNLRHIVLDVKEKTKGLILLVNDYFMLAFEKQPPFDQANLDSLLSFNEAINSLAIQCDVLYADVFEAQGIAPWMIDSDGIHLNNLGHQVTANRIFEVLAQNCSCLSQKALHLRNSFKPWRKDLVSS